METRKPSILVVGSMNMDVMINDVPRRGDFGESIVCGGYGYVPGGKGANQAVAAARLGANAAMAGCLGDDDNGRRLIDNLHQYGVDTKNILRDPQMQTGIALMLVDKDTGRYCSYVIMGGNDYVAPAQVEAALASDSCDMVLMQLEMPLETVYRTYELAAEKGIPVFLDAGPAMQVPLERLKGIFVISPNEAETKALTGIDPVSEAAAAEAARRLYEMASPRYVILKLGERGALLYDGEKAELIPCYTLENAVDSTAAGDTFGAAFAVSYCKGAPVRDAIKYAHAAARICVSRKGAQTSIPSAEEVDAFLLRDHKTDPKL